MQSLPWAEKLGGLSRPCPSTRTPGGAGDNDGGVQRRFPVWVRLGFCVLFAAVLGSEFKLLLPGSGIRSYS